MLQLCRSQGYPESWASLRPAARLAVVRLRKELGAVSRVKPDMVLAATKASKCKLSPPRAWGPVCAGRHAEARARPPVAMNSGAGSHACLKS
jgi:hypothetical protein